jgi:hypothetical protein
LVIFHRTGALQKVKWAHLKKQCRSCGIGFIRVLFGFDSLRHKEALLLANKPHSFIKPLTRASEVLF